MLKKFLAALSVLALSLGMVAFTAAPASAHTPNVSATCEALTVKLTQYQTKHGDQKPNNVKVWIDGTLVKNDDFGTSWSKTFSFPQDGEAHTYHVKVDAWDGHKGTQYDYDTGTKTVQPCEVDVTAAKPTFSHAQCTGPSEYGEGSYTIPSATGVKYLVKLSSGGGWVETEAGSYPVVVGVTVEVKASALSGYVLKGTKSWSEKIKAPKKPCIVKDASASVSVGQPTCDAPGEPTFSIENAVWSDPVDLGSGNFKRTATAVSGHAFADGSTTKTVKYKITGKLDSDSPDCMPEEPTWTQAVCTGSYGLWDGASYTLAELDGITYEVRVGLFGNWTTKAAGIEHEVNAPTYIQVRAKRGGDVIATWTKWFGVPDCWTKVTPVEPDVAQAVCTEVPGEVSPAGYTLTEVTGVKYYVSVNGGGWTLATTGSLQPLAPGDSFRVLAVGDIANSYYIGLVSLNERYFGPYEIADPDCDIELSALGDPLFKQSVCDELEGGVASWSYEVVAADNVTYTWTLNGDDKGSILPGVYAANVGDVIEIFAHADPGYVLDQPYSWTHEFTAEDGFCPPTLGLIVPTAVFDQMSCESGSYTLGNESDDPAGVIWTVNGGTPFTGGGTFPVTSPGLVTVTAIPADGYDFGDIPSPAEWEFDFVAAEDCGDLETLALTGGAAAGSFGLAAALVLIGGLVLAARRRESVES